MHIFARVYPRSGHLTDNYVFFWQIRGYKLWNHLPVLSEFPTSRWRRVRRHLGIAERRLYDVIRLLSCRMDRILHWPVLRKSHRREESLVLFLISVKYVSKRSIKNTRKDIYSIASQQILFINYVIRNGHNERMSRENGDWVEFLGERKCRCTSFVYCIIWQ